MDRLVQYAELLRDWNAKINLISRKDEENILERHILHSLTLAMPIVCEFDFAGKHVIDVGTGGGLPGIPLKIAVPSMDITLVDSVRKKISAVQSMISKLGLQGILATAIRSEDLAKDQNHTHAYDVIISRAVAELKDLIGFTYELLKPGGVLFSLKGGDLTAEIERAERIKGVASVTVKPLALNGYDEFAKEGKKLVRVDFNT